MMVDGSGHLFLLRLFGHRLKDKRPIDIEKDSSLFAMAEAILKANQEMVSSGKSVYFLIQDIQDIELTRALAWARRALDIRSEKEVSKIAGMVGV